MPEENDAKRSVYTDDRKTSCKHAYPSQHLRDAHLAHCWMTGEEQPSKHSVFKQREMRGDFQIDVVDPSRLHA